VVVVPLILIVPTWVLIGRGGGTRRRDAQDGVTRLFTQVHIPLVEDCYFLLEFIIMVQSTDYNESLSIQICWYPLGRLIKAPGGRLDGGKYLTTES
jgi:hypothetical protein